MGIQGLLSFLEKASRPVNISEFSGCTVAVDTYCWLHKGAFSCAEKLARGEHTDQYVNYCMKYVNMLLSHNIRPILVFDGRHLPAKAETEKKRRELRESNRKRAAELLRLERDSEARSLIQRCVDVTHEMASNLIKQCHAQGIDCIVAPYEADAQLAYLNLNGFAHLVITEDSDLMLFGCNLVLFKMDLYGNGTLIEQQKIPLAMKQHPNNFSMDKFRYMCILSGCDYLKSLPGIGLAKACKFIKKTADDNIKRALTRLGSYLNMPNLSVTEDYRDKFLEADFMFKYQPVFDPLTRRVVPLNPLPANITDPFKESLSIDKSYQLALGNLNPFTLEQVDSWSPDEPQKIRTNGWKTTIQRHKSIWSKDYQLPAPLPPKKDPRDVSRPTTKGKTTIHPITTLSEKISTFLPKPNIEQEISKLHQLYGVKTPLSSKKLGEEEEIVNNNENQNVMMDDDAFQGILKTPEKRKESESVECTVDDILGADGSPILEGKIWHNPFSSSGKQKTESQTKKPGGALERFSKLKGTVIMEATIVQSRYFSCPTLERKPHVEQKEGNCNNQTNSDLAASLEDIMASSPPHQERKSFPQNKSFSVLDVIDETSYPPEKKTPIVTPSKKNPDVIVTNKVKVVGSPKKKLFSVTNMKDCKSVKATTSPKPQSFLSIIDSISKSPQDNDNKSEKPIKKLSTPSFKWQQPPLDFAFKKNSSKLETIGGSKKINNDLSFKSNTSSNPISKTPQKSNLIKYKSPIVKKRTGSLLQKDILKKKASENGTAQPSILEKFVFQPKAKLKI